MGRSRRGLRSSTLRSNVGEFTPSVLFLPRFQLLYIPVFVLHLGGAQQLGNPKAWGLWGAVSGEHPFSSRGQLTDTAVPSLVALLEDRAPTGTLALPTHSQPPLLLGFHLHT